MGLGDGGSWHSYPKIYGFGHRVVAPIFMGDYVIQEKVDGSQFSFGLHGGEVKVRSKGKCFPIDAPEKMFIEACETVQRLHDDGKLSEGRTYRCEYLKSKSHNTLCYDRIPDHHLILFDCETSLCTFLAPRDLAAEAVYLGLEVVPTFILPEEPSLAAMEGLLESESVLGGQKMEGIVVKNYERYDDKGHVLMAKHVSEAFKEIHQKSWKGRNPSQNDVILKLIERYKTEARWQKAVQHVREAGELQDSPRDIGNLMRECSTDTHDECEEEIKEILYKWAWPKISRGITGGLAEWYKNQLLAKQFEGEWDVDENGTGPLTGDY